MRASWDVGQGEVKAHYGEIRVHLRKVRLFWVSALLAGVPLGSTLHRVGVRTGV